MIKIYLLSIILKSYLFSSNNHDLINYKENKSIKENIILNLNYKIKLNKQNKSKFT